MAKKVILTIDDEEHILDLLEYNLEKNGYEVLRAETGEKGLAILKTMQVDLVLLDYMLPGMDGIEVLKSLRADKNLSAMPVIMLTAKGEEIDKVLGLEMGARRLYQQALRYPGAAGPGESPASQKLPGKNRVGTGG